MAEMEDVRLPHGSMEELFRIQIPDNAGLGMLRFALQNLHSQKGTEKHIDGWKTFQTKMLKHGHLVISLPVFRHFSTSYALTVR